MREESNVPAVVSIADLPGTKRSARFEGGEHGATVSFFVGRYPPGFAPPLHRHPYEETFIVQDGRATFTVDNETIEAEGGQIIVVPAGAAHRFLVTGDDPLRQVSIHPAERMVQEDVED